MLATVTSWTQAVPVPNAPAAAGTSTIWPNEIARGDPDRTHIGLPDRQSGQHQHDRSISTLVALAKYYERDLAIPLHRFLANTAPKAIRLEICTPTVWSVGHTHKIENPRKEVTDDI